MGLNSRHQREESGFKAAVNGSYDVVFSSLEVIVLEYFITITERHFQESFSHWNN